MQIFEQAAKRHFRDAELLEAGGRYANADHLAGYAAECGLKSILIGFLGSQATNGRPRTPKSGGGYIEHGHLPGLWGEVATVTSGQAAGRGFASLIVQPNPFTDWSIHDRYKDGAAVSAGRALAHIAAARSRRAISRRSTSARMPTSVRRNSPRPMASMTPSSRRRYNWRSDSPPRRASEYVKVAGSR